MSKRRRTGSQTLWDEWKAKLAQQESSGSKQRVDSVHPEKLARLVPSVPIAEFEKHLKNSSRPIANKNSG